MVKHVLLSSQLSELLVGASWSILKNRRIQNGVDWCFLDQVTGADWVPGTAPKAIASIAPSLQKYRKKNKKPIQCHFFWLEDQTCDVCDVCDGCVSSDFGEYRNTLWVATFDTSPYRCGDRRPESYNVVLPTCVCWFINPSNYSYFIIISWVNLVINPLSQLYIVPTYRYGLIINGGNDNLSFGGNSGRWKNNWWYVGLFSSNQYLYMYISRQLGTKVAITLGANLVLLPLV